MSPPSGAREVGARVPGVVTRGHGMPPPAGARSRLDVADDELHSESEIRFFALGQTDAGRFLFVVYTFRGEGVRVISARDMARPERKDYEHARAQELEADPKV